MIEKILDLLDKESSFRVEHFCKGIAQERLYLLGPP